MALFNAFETMMHTTVWGLFGSAQMKEVARMSPSKATFKELIPHICCYSAYSVLSLIVPA